MLTGLMLTGLMLIGLMLIGMFIGSAPVLAPGLFLMLVSVLALGPGHAAPSRRQVPSAAASLRQVPLPVLEALIRLGMAAAGLRGRAR
jgi:hypothetical protein